MTLESDAQIMDALLKLTNVHGLSPNEAISVVEGRCTLQQVLADRAIQEKSRLLSKKSDDDWPKVKVDWDLDLSRWHLSMDDHDQDSFLKKFPDVQMDWANLEGLLANLHVGSSRKKGPFSEPYRSKTARLVVHLQNGGKVSPPMVIRDENGLHVVGGNHRLGWAEYMKQTEVPILFLGKDRAYLESQLIFGYDD
ncbi:hypothetical protein MXMO3_01010 [Maritalea myrionectae]|uniref:ParB/Sulfiredoxin domain-containing protein n=1 Tax=Maritalea myrionectae TaxID=454601 RepID=A0A2R4MBX9_9HYPH|nr:hypothetical protein [Maritalea myrionectae]AVX03541.1 hypothetical protein MXMO3_01010 [Maritalea myrionectae]